MQASVRQSIHASLPNKQILFCIFTVGLVQRLIALLFFELCMEALQHWVTVSFDLDRDPGNCEFQVITSN